MINLQELKKQILLKHNKAFISIINLALLCYIQNKSLNLFQRVISYYTFFANIS